MKFLSSLCTFMPESKTLCMTSNWEGQVDKLEDRALSHSAALQEPAELGQQKTWKQMQSYATRNNVSVTTIGWRLTGYNTALQKRLGRSWCTHAQKVNHILVYTRKNEACSHKYKTSYISRTDENLCFGLQSSSGGLCPGLSFPLQASLAVGHQDY